MPIIHNNNSYPNLKSICYHFLYTNFLPPPRIKPIHITSKVKAFLLQTSRSRPEEEFRHLYTFPTLTIRECPLLKKRLHSDNWDNLSNSPKIILEEY
ncbi:hypothetical protein FRX31_029066 [Thalictrum thalictroides]|uniref:Uncharacterized protein n=1 Tax=Thalictrum thalictroides TaxID=46969 RepID=A0A7J6V997_THATH|nr:hypothetical protein FRX31_029066 [Thalictrum thalictroides]